MRTKSYTHDGYGLPTKNTGFCNAAIHPSSTPPRFLSLTSGRHLPPQPPSPNRQIQIQIHTQTQTQTKTHAQTRPSWIYLYARTQSVVLISIAIVEFVVTSHHPVPPQLPPVPLVRVEVVLVEVGQHGIRGHLR